MMSTSTTCTLTGLAAIGFNLFTSATCICMGIYSHAGGSTLIYLTTASQPIHSDNCYGEVIK